MPIIIHDVNSHTQLLVNGYNMSWVKIAISVLGVMASILGIIQFFRRSKRDSGSPFIALSVHDLPGAVASPLRSIPPNIHSTQSRHSSAQFQIIYGPAGAGKSRAAIDTILTFYQTIQADTVYMARGFIDAKAPLPKLSSVRKVIVFIDDYDIGSAPSSSLSFEDRKSAHAHALANLIRLRNALEARVDLLGIIVTVNSYRMPISQQEACGLLNGFSLIEMPQVTEEEHKIFLRSLEAALNVDINQDARQILEGACDGRFSTIATFFSSFAPWSEITREDAEKYISVQTQVWDLFKAKLSVQQQWVYEAIESIRGYGLPPRLEYLKYLARNEPCIVNSRKLNHLILSIWPINNGKVVVYDGQFGPRKPNSEFAGAILMTCLSVGRRFRKAHRYEYQQELKTLAGYLSCYQNNSLLLRLLKKCIRWFPRDRYFAYLLASAYSDNRRPFRGIRILYRIFNHVDPRIFYSGKWIEIRAHLLLADLYQQIGLHKRRDWESHRKIEHEYELAAMLAGMRLPDIDAEGYELVHSTGPSINWKHELEKDIKELGFEIPTNLSVDSKQLLAMVHHSYSRYLLGQPHHEYAALEHEAVVLKELPEFGEAYLNCAAAAFSLGDSRRALEYLQLASEAKPQYYDEATYIFMIAKERWRAYADLGDIELAQKYYSECREISRKEPLASDAPLQSQLLMIDHDQEYYKRSSQLAQMREKSFGTQIRYTMPAQGIELVLPSNWKIDREYFQELDGCISLLSVFASPLTWDPITKGASDAMVTFNYTNEGENLDKDALSYGIWCLERQQKGFRNKCTWTDNPPLTTRGDISWCEWQFHIHAKWPKSGTLISFELPNARVCLNLMCEDCGQATFKKILESIKQEFIKQPIFNAYKGVNNGGIKGAVL